MISITGTVYDLAGLVFSDFGAYSCIAFIKSLTLCSSKISSNNCLSSYRMPRVNALPCLKLFFSVIRLYIAQTKQYIVSISILM